jgi:hypothetical protein
MAPAHDEIVWAMQLKQEGLTRLQGPKHPRAAGLPKIDLIGIDSAQELKPVLVRDTNPNFHDPSMSTILSDGSRKCGKKVTRQGVL